MCLEKIGAAISASVQSLQGDRAVDQRGEAAHAARGQAPPAAAPVTLAQQLQDRRRQGLPDVVECKEEDEEEKFQGMDNPYSTECQSLDTSRTK